MRRLLVALAILAVIAVGAGALAVFLVEDHVLSGDIVLAWHMDRPILDYAATPHLPWAGSLEEVGGEASLIRLYQALDAARRDESVVGLALHIHDARFGIAKAEEIRRQLHQLREQGKFVECYLETAGEGFNGTLAYFVATACESIRLAPGGDLNLLGLYADRMFLKGTFDKLKIEPQFEHVGEYKSAVETYTQQESSEPAEEALGAVLDEYYANIVGAIAAARDMDIDHVQGLVDGAPYSAAEALELGLVDALSYPDEFSDLVDERAGGDPTVVSIERYGHSSRIAPGRSVAMVFAQGSIRRGHGGIEPWTGELYIGSRDLGKLLHDLGEDDAVDAVVLRIDSPGGSALASDLILREVELVARRKPLIVSMSDVAASGGYYIATKARRIVAEQSTLTGSIGVFGGKLVTSRFERELLGITHDPLQRGANAGIYSPLEAFSETQAERVRTLMRGVYDSFVGHVASGRRMSTADVEAIAEGRIWSGGAALAIGLVDSLGGFGEALRLAREELGVDPDAILHLELYPKPPGLIDYLLGRAQPFLPVALPAPLRILLEEERTELLELPPALADLSRPF
jgi:protease-4